jgi:serine/threonine protein kinase/Tol biopolymer transport system component
VTPERYNRVGRLYHQALELDGAERAEFLEQECAGDELLRREVESLIASHEEQESFLAAPAVEVVARQMADETALSISQRIGHYRVISLLAKGGMGDVYLAQDTRLGRKVALKLLPAEFIRDSGRVRRFEQEARAVSALNHLNILTIFEIGEENGVRYIATEYIDGQTVRELLKGGGLSPSAAISIAAQVAAALAAAHEAGIVHRDIKPENVMLRRDGIVKVLDFGLAKLTEHRPATVDSKAPATGGVNTDPGTVLGTFGYMSPEQVRGQEADHRADIFSLGVVLYEMLSGRRAFAGDSAVEVMNAILKEEAPEFGETNMKVSLQLEKIVRRCLEKQPERRFQSASDLGFALEALSSPSGSRPGSQLDSATASSVAPESHGTLRWLGQARLAWIMAVVMSLVALGFASAYFIRLAAPDEAQVMRFSILPPEKSRFIQIAVSPNGRHLAFTAATGGKVQLWARAFDSTEARALAGTQGARFPFWSPDSRFIGFFADNRLKKVDVAGELVQMLCETPTNPLGGAWSRSGVIIFARESGGGLWRISATGGEVTQVATIDRSRHELGHRYPIFLPDGRHFLYSILSGEKEARGVYLGSLEGDLKRRLLDEVTAIKYMATVPASASGSAGWLVFGRDSALLARPFDTSRLEFTGEPFSLSDKVGSDLVYANYFTFSVSDNGMLVYDPSVNRRRQYLWVDRHGRTINSLDAVAGLHNPWLSPDEKRFITDRLDPENILQDLWQYDVSGNNPFRFTFDPAIDHSPIWAPDGSRIVWASTRDGVANLYQKGANGAGEDTLLLKSEYPNQPTDWSRDGRFIIYRQIDPKTKSDVWGLPTPGSGEAKPPFALVRTEANEFGGTLSPDGRWLAYVSDVSGRDEVYAQNFPGGGGKRQVSNGGGNVPRWRRDGRELFYYAGDGKLMAAPTPRGESLDLGAPVPLFEFRAGTINAFFAPYAVTADGQRFLINAVVEMEPNAPLTVVVNWAAEVKR